MATKVTMPQLGESVTEGTIGKWIVQVGDEVNKYDPLCEVTTDKVNAEVPSSFTGKITDIVATEGETVQVGELICYIEEAESNTQAASEAASNAEGEDSRPQPVASLQEKNEKDDQSMKKRYSPAVLKLAQEHDIDLEQVQGSGKGGRITRKDVKRLIESGQIPDSFHQADEVPQSGEEHSADEHSAAIQGEDKVIPVSQVRKTIATKMVQSKHEAPHAWTMVEVDVTDLVQFRKQVKDTFKQKEGIQLTFLPFFIKATVEALKEFPIINSQWAGDRIIQKNELNISIAVATEDALYVPVIHKADEKSILGLAKAIDDLAHKTRTGKLTQEDMQGGTFTVNNTGSFGSVLSQPIINYPQAAILSVESIVSRPVVKDGMIGVRDMVNVCMSLDHRILDGLVCGRFLQSVKQKLETMGAPGTQTNLY